MERGFHLLALAAAAGTGHLALLDGLPLLRHPGFQSSEGVEARLLGPTRLARLYLRFVVGNLHIRIRRSRVINQGNSSGENINHGEESGLNAT